MRDKKVYLILNVLLIVSIIAYYELIRVPQQQSAADQDDVDQSYWSCYDNAILKIKDVIVLTNLAQEERLAAMDALENHKYQESAFHSRTAGKLWLDCSSYTQDAQETLISSDYQAESLEVVEYTSTIIEYLDVCKEMFIHAAIAINYTADATLGLTSVAAKCFGGFGDCTGADVVNPASQGNYHILLMNNKIEERKNLYSVILEKERLLEESNPTLFNRHEKISTVFESQTQPDAHSGSMRKFFFVELGWALTVETELADYHKVEAGEIPPTEVSVNATMLLDTNQSIREVVLFVNYRLDNRDSSGRDIVDIIVEFNGFEVAHSNKQWFEDQLELDLSSAIPILVEENEVEITFLFQDSMGITLYPDSYIEFK